MPITEGDPKKYFGDPNDEIVDEDGEVNWRNAFAADPGVRKCVCGIYLWNIPGKCPDCGEVVA